MIATKMYTAVFVTATGTRVENVQASFSTDQAYQDAATNCADNESLVALIPGSHAAWSHTYTAGNALKINKTSHVDPFEMPDDYDTDLSHTRFGR
jgi:hypothetical protein